MSVKDVPLEKEVKLENVVKNKLFLLLIKFLYHLLALGYFIYTLFGFLGIDLIILSYFVHISIVPWLVFYLISKKFKFCYVHRLPLYYIGLNELITVSDYYLNIQEDYFTPLVLHVILLGITLFGYSYYYLKFKLR